MMIKLGLVAEDRAVVCWTAVVMTPICLAKEM